MSTSQRDPQTLLPLSPAVFQILLSLTTNILHGFGLMQDIEARTGERIGPATMYRSLDEAVKEGLIEQADQPVESTASRKRRSFYYQITDFGRAVAEAETLRLAKQVDQAASRVFMSVDLLEEKSSRPTMLTSEEIERYRGLLVALTLQHSI